ncbi:MAG: asparagine synthase (glutamine-hydrolyzing) [Magnetococcales bacterium]|nr:asparagine synthase (glutamine-hydrolyzing) [Magnetococcales bacterium]
MCGIAGYAGPTPNDPECLTRMLAPLIPRGPDEEGRFQIPGVSLGMRRLSVIDVAGGQQPVRHGATGVTLVYNGELYNHTELRDQLQKKGHQFHSQSDTEVLLSCYMEYGLGCVDHLNGMFAAAIWDPRENQLILLRDHLGQKPLYYWHDGEHFVFGSDLRALAAHPHFPEDLDPEALTGYLLLRHVPAPRTLYKGVRVLPPGHLLIRNQDGSIRQEAYWQPRFQPDHTMDLAAAVAQFKELWPRVIERHLISDVPLGAFLSGGIDSSLVVAQAAQKTAQFKTFSIAFKEQAFDETNHAREVAQLFGTDHEVFHFESATLSQLLSGWGAAYDQPFSDPALFPTLMLAQETRRQVTVALTGDGADELFAGYQRYRSTVLGRQLLAIPGPIRQGAAGVLSALTPLLSAASPSRRYLDAVARRLKLVEPDLDQEYQRQFYSFDDETLAAIMPHPAQLPAPPIDQNHPAGLLAALLTRDLQGWLPDQMLVKTDRATMAHSLEARLPFLDREVVELAQRIPPKLHWGKKNIKNVLRQAAEEILPPHLAQRPKHGFGVPVDRWLRENREQVEALLSQGAQSYGEFLDPAGIQNVWQAHRSNRQNHGERLLNLLILFAWNRGSPA